MAKQIQVLEADPTYTQMDYGHVPEILADIYRAKGHNLILTYNSPQNVSAMAMKNAYAVMLDEVPDDQRAEVKRQLTRAGLRWDSTDGTIHKGDCLLVSQPEGARAHFEAENYQAWINQGYASDTQAEAIQEEAMRASHRPGARSPFAGAKTEGGFRGHFGRAKP
jgi:hypothetical protein